MELYIDNTNNKRKKKEKRNECLIVLISLEKNKYLIEQNIMRFFSYFLNKDIIRKI